CPISVLLPAPFGPMMACSSPGCMASVMASEATTPPKRLVRASMRSSPSATTHALQQPVDPPACEQNDEEEQRPQHHLPVFLDSHGNRRLHKSGCEQPNQNRQQFLQDQERHGADQRAERRCHAAKNDHDDKVARARPMHGGGADEAGVVCQQRTGEPADRTPNDETGQAIATSRETERMQTTL